MDHSRRFSGGCACLAGGQIAQGDETAAFEREMGNFQYAPRSCGRLRNGGAASCAAGVGDLPRRRGRPAQLCLRCALARRRILGATLRLETSNRQASILILRMYGEESPVAPGRSSSPPLRAPGRPGRDAATGNPHYRRCAQAIGATISGQGCGLIRCCQHPILLCHKTAHHG